MKIAVTGATGLIGTKLCGELIKAGNSLAIFSGNTARAKKIIPKASEYFSWNYRNPDEWGHALEGVDAVIHLAGANISGKRWSKEYKLEIFESRKISTQNIVKVISGLKKKPGCFICSSGVNYYGESGDNILDENAAVGNDFLAGVCAAWEEETGKASGYGVRTVSIRTGVVLSGEGGALPELMLPFKMFAGGPIGNGRQWFPWIHIDDLVNIYLFALNNGSVNNAVNATAPHPVTMNEFAGTLGKILKRPSFFRIPVFLLRLVIGESAEAVTASMRAVPSKLIGEGFRFKFEFLDPALRDLIIKKGS